MSLSDYHGIRDLWRETTGDSRICVAVIDGVVDLEHACFSGADLKQFDADAVAGVRVRRPRTERSSPA